METNKFRGWYNGEMLPAVDLSGPRHTWEWFGEADAELMQYTGLNDKDDVEIYEGDIIQLHYAPTQKGMIFWSDDNACFWQTDGITKWGFCANPRDYIVVGNIKQNPELLEKSN